MLSGVLILYPSLLSNAVLGLYFLFILFIFLVSSYFFDLSFQEQRSGNIFLKSSVLSVLHMNEIKKQFTPHSCPPTLQAQHIRRNFLHSTKKFTSSLCYINYSQYLNMSCFISASMYIYIYIGPYHNLCLCIRLLGKHRAD